MPAVVLLTVDQLPLNPFVLGGGSDPLTNWDRLSAQAVRFDRFHLDGGSDDKTANTSDRFGGGPFAVLDAEFPPIEIEAESGGEEIIAGSTEAADRPLVRFRMIGPDADVFEGDSRGERLTEWDLHLGTILDAIDTRFDSETLLILTTERGDDQFILPEPFAGHRPPLAESDVWVPALIRQPNREGWRSQVPVQPADIIQTVRAQIEENSAEDSIAGFDLAAYLAHAEPFPRQISIFRNRTHLAIRTDVAQLIARRIDAVTDDETSPIDPHGPSEWLTLKPEDRWDVANRAGEYPDAVDRWLDRLRQIEAAIGSGATTDAKRLINEPLEL